MTTWRKGAIGQNPIGVKPIGKGDYDGITQGDITQSAPSFSQAIVADWTENHEGQIANIGTAFSQSASGTLTEYTVTADIANVAPVFTQDASGTVAQKTVTGDITNTGTTFSQQASDQENPPRVASIDQTAPLFTQDIAVVHVADTKTGSIVQTAPSFSQDGDINTNETVLGTISNNVNNRFSQYIDGKYSDRKTNRANAAQTMPFFSQGSSGTVNNKTLTGNVIQEAPKFVTEFTGDRENKLITGQISTNAPIFSADSAGTIDLTVHSVNISGQSPTFTQNIDAQYVISSANADISGEMPQFSTTGRILINDGRIRSEAPSFVNTARALRISNANLFGVVEPITVTTIGNIVEEDSVPNTYTVNNVLELDRASSMTMDRSVKPITMNINVIINVDFKQKLTTNLNQKKVMNYVSS